MRFYLLCIAILTFMLFGLHQCGAQVYMQTETHSDYGKGGEAKRERLYVRKHHRAHKKPPVRANVALSTAVPRPRPIFNVPVFGRALADELLPTPQSRIDNVFQQLEEFNAGISNC